MLGPTNYGWLVVFFTSHRQRGHLETATPFIDSCEGCEAWFLHLPHQESNPGLLRGSPLVALHNPCATPAPQLIMKLVPIDLCFLCIYLDVYL